MTTPIPEKCPKCGAERNAATITYASWKCGSMNGPNIILNQKSDWLDGDLCLARQEIAALKERAEKAEARAENLEDRIDAWKMASGLERGGDPSEVEPDDLDNFVKNLTADRDSLRADLDRVTEERDEARGIVRRCFRWDDGMVPEEELTPDYLRWRAALPGWAKE